MKGKDAVASGAISAVQRGDLDALRRLLDEHPGLATERIVDDKGVGRTLLHVVADWPGHFPNGAQVVNMLINAGADPNAGVTGVAAHRETPLHWAASSDDVEVLDALLDGGADIEACGGVFTNGPAMADAVIFAQWNAARRLLARGAKTTIWQAAALGLTDDVEQHITNAFWHACRGGQVETAKLLFAAGADVNWVGHDGKTALTVARESGAADLVVWLAQQGAL